MTERSTIVRKPFASSWCCSALRSEHVGRLLHAKLRRRAGHVPRWRRFDMLIRAEFIREADDPRIASYANVRDRDLAGRDDAFIIEGEVVVRMLLAPTSRFRP